MGRWPAQLAVRLGAPLTVGVERHDIDVRESLGSAETLRIAFASDFHCGPNTPERLIDSAIEQLKRAQPDLLLLGGDFVSARADYFHRDLARRLAEIPAPLGRYAVLGNHDYWTDAEDIVEKLHDAGIEMVTNRCVRLPRPCENVSLCGLDDHTTGEPDSTAAFRNSQGVRVVLMHAPSNLLDVGNREFAVAFCGHTHGGQIALPNGKPIKVAHGPLSRRYNAGRFDLENGRVLLVSRGIGCTTLPLRVNAPAAVLTCTIRYSGR